MRRAAGGLVALAMALAAPDVRAEGERPETSHWVWAGLGMAIPTYFIGVAVHEGSHALAAESVGADVIELHLLPGVRHGKFYFGYVRVTGLESTAERVFFLTAPKLVDVTLLGSYAALVLTDTTPDNHYGRLALAVLATGFWVDFSKDIPAFWKHSDIVKVYDHIGATSELRRLPLRLIHAGLSAGAAYAIVRGYQDVFGDQSEPGAALVLPLLAGSF
ncbi:MAG TPA: hypothetical protein VKZ63_03065 [Kofleriaceae bacterium]|nr:hypothetical protein [Kofleriaceae bacterium]